MEWPSYYSKAFEVTRSLFVRAPDCIRKLVFFIPGKPLQVGMDAVPPAVYFHTDPVPPFSFRSSFFFPPFSLPKPSKKRKYLRCGYN